MEHWPQRLHPSLAAAALGFSVGILALGALLVPLVVVRMPADYLVRDARASHARAGHSPLRLVGVVLRNALGAVLLLAGIAMLFLPGQGVLTILAALTLLDVPGKRRLERKLLGLSAVRAVITKIRKRAGRPPLQL
jgi:hypothetical protein